MNGIVEMTDVDRPDSHTDDGDDLRTSQCKVSAA